MANRLMAVAAAVTIALRWSQGAGPPAQSIDHPKPLNAVTPRASVTCCHRARHGPQVMPAIRIAVSSNTSSPDAAAARPARNLWKLSYRQPSKLKSIAIHRASAPVTTTIAACARENQSFRPRGKNQAIAAAAAAYAANAPAADQQNIRGAC